MNARGLCNEHKRRLIFEYTRRRAEIICLQETHSIPSNEKYWSAEWGGQCVFSHGDSYSCGVAILIKKDSNVRILRSRSDQQGRFVIAEIKTSSDAKYTICSIYAPNKDNAYFFDALDQNLADFSSEKIIIGDFNVVLDIYKDRFNSTFNPQKSFNSLKELMYNNQLSDTWRERNENVQFFSWKRHENNQASRIDYALISKGTETKCDNIMYYQSVESDHAVIFVSIADTNIERGKGYWKLNSALLKNTDFLEATRAELVKDIECTKNMEPMDRWEKIKNRISKTMQKFSRQIAAERNSVISHLSEVLSFYEQKFPLSKDEMEMYSTTKVDLTEKLYEKTRGSIFRSKAKWYAEGETSSKYFFNLERSRSNARNCYAILKEDGTLIEQIDDIIKEQRQFYSNLYKKDDTVRFNLQNNTNCRFLNMQQHSTLNEDLKIKEISNAITALKSKKAPGPDGIPAEFYKAYKKELQEILFEAYQQAFQLGMLHETARNGILNLIPKGKKDSRILKNLRPITLLNV